MYFIQSFRRCSCNFRAATIMWAVAVWMWRRLYEAVTLWGLWLYEDGDYMRVAFEQHSLLGIKGLFCYVFWPLMWPAKWSVYRYMDSVEMFDRRSNSYVWLNFPTDQVPNTVNMRYNCEYGSLRVKLVAVRTLLGELSFCCSWRFPSVTCN